MSALRRLASASAILAGGTAFALAGPALTASAAGNGAAPGTPSQAAFIASIAPGAQQGEKTYGVPASVTIAQAILESGWGKSRLTAEQHNLFGIKCSGVNGPYATGCAPYDTRECNGSLCWMQKELFRTYRDNAASLADHGRFLKVNSRYAPAFKTGDDDAFVREVHRAGYATDPRYSDIVISLMKQYDLYRYDVSR